MQCDHKITECPNRERNRIGDILRPRRNSNILHPAKRQRLIASRIDSSTTSRRRSRHMHRSQMQRSRPKGIRDMHPQLRPTDGEMNDLPQRSIPKILRRKRVLRLRQLLRSRPRTNPICRNRGLSCQRHQNKKGH